MCHLSPALTPTDGSQNKPHRRTTESKAGGPNRPALQAVNTETSQGAVSGATLGLLYIGKVFSFERMGRVFLQQRYRAGWYFCHL